MEKNAFITVSILIVFVLVATSSAAQTIEHDVKNETILITPLVNETAPCHQNITTVFYLRRAQYTTGMDSISISYEQETHHDGTLMQSRTVTKKFKKYTRANTGLFAAKQSGTYSLLLKLENKTHVWTVNISCQDNNTVNTSINHPTNTTLNQTNNTNQTNISLGNTTPPINLTINQTTNKTLNQTNNTNQTNHSLPATQRCPLQGNITTDKIIYTPGEKASIKFLVYPWRENTSIRYSIQTLSGKTVKQPYTTHNTNTKRYTFKAIDHPSQAYFITATIEQHCNSTTVQRLVVVQNNEHKDEKATSNSIEIAQFQVEEERTGHNVQTTILIEKGQTRKTSIRINFLDEKGNKALPEQKIYVKTTASQQELTIKLPLPEKFKAQKLTMVVTGLGISVNKTTLLLARTTKQITTEAEHETKTHKINNPIITNNYTRNTYYAEKITWNVRVKAQGEVNISLQAGENNITKTADIQDEETIPFELHNIFEPVTIKINLQQKNNTQTYTQMLRLKTKETTQKTVEPLQTTTPLLTAQATQVISEQTEATKRQNKGIWIATIGLLALVFLGLRFRKVFDRFIKQARLDKTEKKAQKRDVHEEKRYQKSS